MTPLIKKAHRGNRDAMTTLYQLNKQQVFYICSLLLCDPKSADNACVHVFKNTWDCLLNGKITTEEEFTDFVIKKAVSHCKNKITKGNNKAFKIPQNKNFATTQYSASTITTNGDSCNQILASLPPLHRFIYVLSFYVKWSDADIAELIRTKSDVVKAALDAEQINLDKIANAIKQKTGEEAGISSSEFHMLMGSAKYSAKVTHAVDTVVILAIDSIAEPIERRAKQKTIKISLISVISCVLAFLLIFGIVKLATLPDDSADSDDTDGTSDYVDDTGDEITWLTEVESPTHYAIIDIADYGQITVALDGNSAPETVENFVTLAEEGFYDGLTFHRIIEGFMMQGGDPDADGTGGNTDEDGNEINIIGEFYYNGYDNYLSHVRGAISMARATDYDSASSQFFIVHEDSTDSLDMLYAAFGYVIEGMDVVDAVCEAAEPTDDNGTISAEDQPVITSITIYTPEEYEQLLADSTPDAEPVAIDAKIAEVTAISDGVLSLTIYGLTESGAEYEITDLKDVDLTKYEATEETEEYTIASGTVIYTVVDGELTEIESSEIVVGDVLVIDDGADEGVTIVVYHAEDNSDSEGTESGDGETGDEGDGTVTE